MRKCPRCLSGYLTIRFDSIVCMLCAYEDITIPQDVLNEVQKSYGKRRLANSEPQLPGLVRKQR